MGVELLEIGVKMKKGAIFTMKACLRSVCNHPFFVGMLCFMIFLYRSSPFIFSLLVSASPILVCTAVLLGTLLSFGEPNIPEIEIEEKTTHDAVLLNTGFSGDTTTVVEKNDSHFVERFNEIRRDLSEDSAPLIEERSREVEELNDGENPDREIDDLLINNDGEVKYAPIANDDVFGSDDEKSDADSFDSEKVNVDTLDSPPRSPWTRAEEREADEEREKKAEEEEDDDEDDLDSESDRAESSSPDASMADIMPMLDELHPLLDQEAPRPAHGSHSGSDTENHDDVEVGDDDDDDDEEDDEEGEEDGAQGDKEEEIKSPIKWTEEDQKNLMDLGTSEIERNQRLENLILRRRARRNMSMFQERNLIDFESVDLPFNIAPITTRRQNPFDLPHDSDDNLGLPPIPGSAPSILLPRRNPFDIPYDSSEEKPDLLGDGFQEDFVTSSREPVFRRHESFNVGPSIFAPHRSDVRMRPYFIPERSISRESSFSSSFQRQSSGLSDSKVSSVPDTESVTSVEDIVEDKKLLEEDLEKEIEHKKEVTEEDGNQGVAENLGHGSQSSEEEIELQLGGVAENLNSESFEQKYSRDSSLSSLSEVSERVFIETDGEGPLEGRREEDVGEERVISTQTSVESNEIPHRYPVYDSSPRGVGPAIVKRTVSFTEGENEGSREMEREMWGVDQRIEDQNVGSTEERVNSNVFDDKAMHEPIFKHLGEVEASTTTVEQSEDIQTIQRPSMLEIQELDHQIFSNVNSPLSPHFNSLPSGISQTNFPQNDLQTIVEETDEIKEIDEGLLSELDNVGDFRVTQWESGSNEFEKQNDSVVESLSSSHYAEPSEIISVEENITENVKYSENSREDEDMKYITEQETSQTSIAEHIDVPRMELDETDGQDSPDRGTSEVVNQNYGDNISGISNVEMGSTEDIADGMHELEASTIEDIDTAFKQISAEEIDYSVVLEPTGAELAAAETITETDPTCETTVLEVGPIENDASLDYDPVIVEPPQTEPVAREATTECSEVDSTHETSILEVRPFENDVTSECGFDVLEPLQAEPIVVESPQSEPVAREAIIEGSEMDPTQETLVLEVRSIDQDASLDCKPVSLEPPQAEQVVGEAISEHSETDPTNETSVLEVRPIEDAVLDYKPVVVELPQAEPVVVEPPHSEPVVMEAPETKPVVLEPLLPQAEPVAREVIIEPVVGEPPQAEPVVLEPPQAEQVDREAVIECSETNPTNKKSVLEVRPTEDAALDYNPVSLELPQAKAVVVEPPQDEPVVLEPPQVELVAREAVIERSETDCSHEASVLEGRPIEDATLDHKPLVLELPQAETVVVEPSQAEPVVVEPPQVELVAREAIKEHSQTDPTHGTPLLEVRPIEDDATLGYNQSNDDSTATHILTDSVDHSSELNIAEPNSSRVGSSVEESREPDNKVESPKDSHSATSVKEKGKKLSKSKSSSSSSSSSSESSSSDSDKE